MSTQKQQKQSKLDQLRDRSRQAEAGGGAARIEKQHAADKMTARERVDFLLDEGTFQEFDKLVEHRSRDFGLDKQNYPGDGVVTGHGLIDGRKVFVFAQDFTVFGGSLSDVVPESAARSSVRRFYTVRRVFPITAACALIAAWIHGGPRRTAWAPPSSSPPSCSPRR